MLGILKMQHREDVLRECAWTRHPGTFKGESQGFVARRLAWQAVPGKRRTQPPVHPNMPIRGTPKGAIKYGETHRGAYGIDEAECWERGTRTNHRLVYVEVRHNNMDTRGICECPLTRTRMRDFQNTLDFRGHSEAVVETPGRREIYHIQETHITESHKIRLVHYFLDTVGGACYTEKGGEE